MVNKVVYIGSHSLPIICRGRRYRLITRQAPTGHRRGAYRFAASGRYAYWLGGRRTGVFFGATLYFIMRSFVQWTGSSDWPAPACCRFSPNWPLTLHLCAVNYRLIPVVWHAIVRRRRSTWLGHKTARTSDTSTR